MSPQAVCCHREYADATDGSLLVNDRLQTFWEDSEELNEDVLALGDCATLVSGKLPATAQVASQQAKYVAKALNREAQQRSPSKPFKFFNMVRLLCSHWPQRHTDSKAGS